MLFKNHPLHKARSAGTSEKARIRVNEKLVNWATEIFVMEKKHKDMVTARFHEALKYKQITILEIEDNYQYGDEELIGLLKQALESYLI